MPEKQALGRPFTPESARAAAQRSAEVRRERMVSRKRYADVLDALLAEFGARERLGPLAFAATAKVIEAAIRDDIPAPTTALDRLRLLEVARVAHTIGRLEFGESTSNGARITLDLSSPEMRDEHLRSLQERINRLTA